MKLLLSQAQHAMQALGDIPEEQDREVAGICTDSRLLRAGELFICLTGEYFDGHNFIDRAVQAGACGIVACVPQTQPCAVPVLMVQDTLQALGRLAGFWRQQTEATVIAVTGSAGKTTVKELLSAVLAQKGQTAKNKGNFNNEIGVPVSILETTGNEDFWILELGINQPGEMERLGALVRPDMAVIHNIGPVHLEGLGDITGVAHAKTAILRYLAPDGQACVNSDYELLWNCAQEILPLVTGFSTATDTASFYGEYTGAGRTGGHYRLVLDGTCVEVTLPLYDDYLVENILAAATVAWQLGATAEQIQQGLAEVVLPEHRLRTRHWHDGHDNWLLLDDTYNANPLSMERALSSAAAMSSKDNVPLVLVLGEMGELGSHSAQHHCELGRHIARTAAAFVFYKGNYAADVRRGLAAHGWQGSFIALTNAREFPAQFAACKLSAGIMLFKGSRSAAMETFFEALISNEYEQAVTTAQTCQQTAEKIHYFSGKQETRA